MAGLGSVKGALGGAMVLGFVEAGLALHMDRIGTNSGLTLGTNHPVVVGNGGLYGVGGFRDADGVGVGWLCVALCVDALYLVSGVGVAFCDGGGVLCGGGGVGGGVACVDVVGGGDLYLVGGVGVEVVDGGGGGGSGVGVGGPGVGVVVGVGAVFDGVAGDGAVVVVWGVPCGDDAFVAGDEGEGSTGSGLAAVGVVLGVVVAVAQGPVPWLLRPRMRISCCVVLVRGMMVAVVVVWVWLVQVLVLVLRCCIS